jgi:hypothetical protein
MSERTQLRVERETRLIVTDDAYAAPILCIAARQPLSVGYDMVRAYNAFPDLLAALDECATRFERCCIHSGSDKEFAASAVADYRAVIKRAKP